MVEGFLQEALELGKGIASKINPILDKIAVKLGEFVGVSSENIHLGLILLISLWISYMIFGRRFKLSTLIGAGAIWLGLKWLGL